VMTQNQLLERFTEAGMIERKHVVLTSGYHTDTYINCALPLITLNPIVYEIVEALGRKLNITESQKGGPVVIFSVGKAAHYGRMLAEWAKEHYNGWEFLFLYGQRMLEGELT